jgi:predicted alpha-1,2-mannosidase
MKNFASKSLQFCLVLSLGVVTVADVRLDAQGATKSAAQAALTAVDPIIGSANDGNTYPGATVPFGMIQWSPDTQQNFYYYDQKKIRGFSVTHLSGVGCPVFGDFPILPMSERPSETLDLEHPATAAFDHSHEIAQAGYYSVVLEDGTRVELTTSDRSGMARLTYPQGKHAGLLVNGAGSASTDVHISFLPPVGREKDAESLSFGMNGGSDGVLMGTVTAGGFCGTPTRYTLHAAFAFQHKPVSHALWQDAKLLASGEKAAGKRAAAWIDLGAGDVQIVKVGLSYVSDEGARANLQHELPGWDFDAAKAKAQARWETALGKISIEAANDDDRKIFYTGLYHELSGQTLFSDVDGQYMGFDGKPHHLHAGQKGQYTNISDWDIYRNTVQLQALLYPQEASDLAQSLVNDAEQMGSYPRWAAANDSTYVMGGDSPAPILASVYAFGATGFDAKQALAYAIKGATTPGLGIHDRFERVALDDYLKLGYISSKDEISASETLEFTSDDFAIAQLAKALGDNAAYERMLKQSANWRNLMDPETKWIRPRNADGSWLAGFDAEKSLPKRGNASVSTDQKGFEEGNTYQYSFMLPFDYAGVFSAMGGEAAAEKRLDHFFEKLVCWGEPCFNMANEPDFVTPYAYTFMGKPWKTAAVMARVEKETFNTTPGGIPGNDDLGATSGVYLWNAMGMYPAIPGLGGVVLGSPRYTKTVVHLGNGKTLTITRHGAGNYVQSVMLNGKPYASSWVKTSALLGSNATLDFSMSETPGSSWATAIADRPPSVSAAK